MTVRKAMVLAMGVWLAAGLPAWADRPPTTAERAQIERELRQLGYVSWDEIELEDRDGLWEVDDARTADGKEFELRLKPGTLKVVSRRPD